MGLIRLPKAARKHYTTIENDVLQDARLSYGARGLLGYLLSKPDDWQVKTKDLIAQSPAGRHLILRALKELEKYGYLKRKRVRLADGKYGWTTTVIERPEKETGRLNYADYLKSSEWAEKRDEALKRAAYRCQLCNSTAALNVHHRSYENLGHELSSDLIVLCKECHSKFHDKVT